MAEPVKAKCADCATTDRVHPWGEQRGDGAWTYTWRCGSCQYKREHPGALPAPPRPRRPKAPQRETLDDALTAREDGEQ